MKEGNKGRTEKTWRGEEFPVANARLGLASQLASSMWCAVPANLQGLLHCSCQSI